MPPVPAATGKLLRPPLLPRRAGRPPVRHAGRLLRGRRRARPTEGNRGRLVAQGRSARFPAVPPANTSGSAGTLKRGYLGLQAENGVHEYRNLRIKDLSN